MSVRFSIVLLLVGFSALPALAAPSPSSGWLGVFTTDTYPKAQCEVVDVGSYLYTGTGGWQPQPESSRQGYLSSLNEKPYQDELAAIAQSRGYNAILGFQFQIAGGFTGYEGGRIVNGMIGVGAFYISARGTPVTVRCK